MNFYSLGERQREREEAWSTMDRKRKVDITGLRSDGLIFFVADGMLSLDYATVGSSSINRTRPVCSNNGMKCEECGLARGQLCIVQQQ